MASQATPETFFQATNLTIVDLDHLADTLAESEIITTADLGSTLVHKVKHPIRGTLILVNTTGLQHLELSACAA